ncbi:hypothetical protein [Actinoplanes sp. NPDC026619]|uniref:hypothetical protein n=1 Tax=Actinoplanes sp. NPDC026619 TaxID=3155798 RepID=UPI0033E815E7
MLWILYRNFQLESAVPEPPRDRGEVQLFFDRPSVPAVLEVRIDDRHPGSAMIDYQINLDDDYAGPSVRFFLTFSGSARVPETYPNGDPDQTVNGCWHTASVVLAEEDAASCYEEKLGSGAGYTAPEYRVDTQVVTGVMGGKDAARRFVSVTAFPRHGYSTSAGKRTYFALPGFGTPYIPAGYRAEADKELGRNNRGYVPSRLDMSVDYGELAATERLDSIAPDPGKAGTKSWVELDASMLEAHGSIVNNVLEEKAQRNTFLYGAFVGIAATLLPILVQYLVGLWRRPAAAAPAPGPPEMTPRPASAKVSLPGTELLHTRLQRSATRSARTDRRG